MGCERVNRVNIFHLSSKCLCGSFHPLLLLVAKFPQKKIRNKMSRLSADCWRRETFSAKATISFSPLIFYMSSSLFSCPTMKIVLISAESGGGMKMLLIKKLIWIFSLRERFSFRRNDYGWFNCLFSCAMAKTNSFTREIFHFFWSELSTLPFSRHMLQLFMNNIRLLCTAGHLRLFFIAKVPESRKESEQKFLFWGN